ncbi:HORMA domain-containing protein 1 [Lampris incognitus]|uniref:HORMA domain-containing protein 1 n=1 Tax=Lampris incognitus TaxID=2546036 RepID=UPI0024B49579|nr:HORMA domain-containing protein 1 [Lampris incognitus]
MASIQLSSVAQSQDVQLLPNAVVTEQQSLIVVKRLLAIAVSSITYLRGLFPEKAYGTKFVEEQKVMILKEERSCPGATQLVEWIRGCFDAIQRKYLRSIVLSIYGAPEQPQMVTEYYQFRIQYTATGPQVDLESNSKVAAMSCSNTKKASILLIRKLYTLVQNLGPLPDSVSLNMKLSYYDNVTPQDYQPPGFKEGDSDMFEFERQPLKVTMGEAVTPFHKFTVDVSTEKERLEQVEKMLRKKDREKDVDKVDPVHVRGKWILHMDGSVAQSKTTKELEKPDVEMSYLDDSETQMSSQEKTEVWLEGTGNSQVETVAKGTSETEMALKRRWPRRVIKLTKRQWIRLSQAAVEVGIVTIIVHESSSAPEYGAMSQFEILSSQECVNPSSSMRKRRKFSEPKEC